MPAIGRAPPSGSRARARSPFRPGARAARRPGRETGRAMESAPQCGVNPVSWRVGRDGADAHSGLHDRVDDRADEILNRDPVHVLASVSGRRRVRAGKGAPSPEGRHLRRSAPSRCAGSRGGSPRRRPARPPIPTRDRPPPGSLGLRPTSREAPRPPGLRSSRRPTRTRTHGAFARAPRPSPRGATSTERGSRERAACARASTASARWTHLRGSRRHRRSGGGSRRSSPNPDPKLFPNCSGRWRGRRPGAIESGDEPGERRGDLRARGARRAPCR